MEARTKDRTLRFMFRMCMYLFSIENRFSYISLIILFELKAKFPKVVISTVSTAFLGR